jgi:hypothetical protein
MKKYRIPDNAKIIVVDEYRISVLITHLVKNTNTNEWQVEETYLPLEEII